MKMFIVLATLVAVVLAAPQHHQHQQQQHFDSGNQDVVVVKETPLDNIGVGGYNFGYQLSNGESREESAQVVNEGQENQSLVVRGSFSWVDPVSGQEYKVSYVADENGYRPEGAHLPA